MEYSFFFESKFREWEENNFLKFRTTDGTEFSMSEVWLIATEKKKDTPIHKIRFHKANNYDKTYNISVEVSIANNYRNSGKFIISKSGKDISTSVVILLPNYDRLNYGYRGECKTIVGVPIHGGFVTEIFRYKITITSNQDDAIPRKYPKRDNILAFSDSVHSLLQTGEFSDVVITDGHSEIKAHRNILSARSQYFKCMFSNDWKENIERLSRVQVTSMKTMNELMHYIYSGIIRYVEFDMLYDLFVANDFYQVEDLKKLLSAEIAKRINLQNVIYVLKLAHFYKDSVLKSACLKFVVGNFDQVTSSESWRWLENEDDGRDIIQEINEEGNRVERNISE